MIWISRPSIRSHGYNVGISARHWAPSTPGCMCCRLDVISYLRAIGEWPFPNRLTIATPIEAVARVFALPNACELLAPGELVAASEVAYRNRNFGLAVQAMKQLVERTSTEPRRWCRLANFQQLAGDVEGAIESYRAAIALDGRWRWPMQA